MNKDKKKTLNIKKTLDLAIENHPSNLANVSGWPKILYVFDDPIELSIGQKVVITAASLGIGGSYI